VIEATIRPGVTNTQLNDRIGDECPRQVQASVTTIFCRAKATMSEASCGFGEGRVPMKKI
jgi:hypothetical protein